MKERFEYLLEQFFDRVITPAEQLELEQLIARDASFAEQFGFQQKIAATVVSNERNQLKKILQAEEAKHKGLDNGGWSIWTKSLLAAAAAIALVVIVPILMKPRTQVIEFTPFPNEFASAAGDSGAKTLLEEASKAYQSQDYAEAAVLFGQLGTDNPAYALYGGIAQAGARHYAEAVQILYPLANSGQPDYARPAQYYLAWCYYQKGEKEAAQNAAAIYLSQKPKRGEELFEKNARLIGQQK